MTLLTVGLLVPSGYMIGRKSLVLPLLVTLLTVVPSDIDSMCDMLGKAGVTESNVEPARWRSDLSCRKHARKRSLQRRITMVGAFDHLLEGEEPG